jgi:hypothetical protein
VVQLQLNKPERDKKRSEESKKKAKRNWPWVYTEKCQHRNFQENPKHAWKMVFKMIEGFQSHHKSFVPEMFKNSKGKTPKDSTKKLKSYWPNTFNRHADFDETVLKGIQVYATMDSFGQTPEKIEIKAAIKRMKYGKAPGARGLSTDMIKSLCH